MMNQGQMGQVIQQAKQTCRNSGRGLTEKRQRVLEILLKTEDPMSAYELTDAYNQIAPAPIMAMSVYRILVFLESMKLVHRLHSANKYMACTQLSGQCDHPFPLFLICTLCQKVEETSVPTNLVKLLTQSTKKSGFLIAGSQLEINGLCSKCQSASSS